jgi:tRNA(fMet)-specific endonuclease VapC
MSRYILDTDCVTLFQHGNSSISQRIQAVGRENIFVTVVTLQEQLQGRLAVINQVAKSPELLENAYRNLRITQAFFCRINLLDFDARALACYQNLRQQRIRIGTQDLRIAAIALALQTIIVTRNSQDFGKVPHLVIEDWSLG